MQDNTLKNKKILVTGASSGIGFTTSWLLAKMGAEVYMVSRDHHRGEAALKTAKINSGSNNIHLLIADLSSLSDVDQLAKDFKRDSDGLDILINNAAIAPRHREISKDGIEMQFAVNHLSHFLLTESLLPVLQVGPDSRIINISSMAHTFGSLDLDDIEFKRRPYSTMKVYGTTKHMNILYTKDLAERLISTNIHVHALHPGAVATNFYRFAPSPIAAFLNLFLLSPEKGSSTTVYLASSPEGGRLTGEFWVRKKPKKLSSKVLDSVAAKRLTEISKDYCKGFGPFV
jgi:retinol dehydrogenase 14